MRALLPIFLLLASPLAAQDDEGPATLIADSVAVVEGDTLSAKGNVEIFQGETRLTASRVTYDGQNDRIIIEGPITVYDGESTVTLADQAELSEGLQNGILRGARLVLDQQLQVSAVEFQRVDGRYTQGFRVAATSCHVCQNGRAPLWQIRARRIVHDAEERQLYFDDAQFQVLGVPIFYMPRMRLPDPTLERATGVLIPTVETSSLLGNGVTVPYFFVLGDNADLTLTPRITTRSRTLDIRYRRAFRSGEIDWTSYVSKDEVTNDDFQFGVLADGRFDLARGFELAFDIETESRRGYLSDYDYSSKDRLDSAISLSRTRARDVSFIELVGLRSIRDGENDDTFPELLVEARHALRVGDRGLLELDYASYSRGSDSAEDVDGDGIADGLDRARFGATFDWRRSEVLRFGVIFEAKAEAAADLFLLSDDPAFDSRISRSRGAAALGLRWPLVKRSAGGEVNVLEPHVQLAYSDAEDADIPNEVSTRIEFDEGNLFALNRAVGDDFVEVGTRLDMGLTWRRIGPAGWKSAVTLGFIERLDGDGEGFTDASGLSGSASNWLISGALRANERLDVIGRVILDTDLDVTKSDLRLDYDAERVRFATSYAYLAADPAEDRITDASELALATEYDFTPTLTGAADFRYDFTTDATTEAGLGLRYTNECVEVDLSVSRTFTSSTNVSASTDFELTVRLMGFGTGSRASAVRKASCG